MGYCFIYSKKGVNAISICISIIIYIFISAFFQENSNGFKVKARLMQIDGMQLSHNEKFDWYLEIPKIKLKAKIQDGTDSDILNRYIGHFEETPKENGNIGLAAHNRGYKVNYFENIKELNKGDKIFYYYNRKNSRI